MYILYLYLSQNVFSHTIWNTNANMRVIRVILVKQKTSAKNVLRRFLSWNSRSVDSSVIFWWNFVYQSNEIQNEWKMVILSHFTMLSKLVTRRLLCLANNASFLCFKQVFVSFCEFFEFMSLVLMAEIRIRTSSREFHKLKLIWQFDVWELI